MARPAPPSDTPREAPSSADRAAQFFPDDATLTALYESGQRDLRELAARYAHGTPVQRQAMAAKHSYLFERYSRFSRGLAAVA
ncbi:hypothetical protein SAMN05216551_109134 [Chitinasiproducens palmae]|uniref:Uncharacterized protein n=1 Tax=Chitinasiproducens palmae TaxID=1770053 RepID=A0A1H2PU04_9BURK|nr:hypothetical protein SAMN05216551_109134 [Chitinasiproducens palmae]